MIRTIVQFAALAWGAWSLGSCTSSQNPGRPNVLLVVVDTLRQDHLEPYGYQKNATSTALNEFAKESVVWNGVMGASTWTMPNMATLFTGKDPGEHGVMRMVGAGSRLTEPDTLAVLFRKAGYSTACVMSNFLLRADRGVGFHRGFDVWDDSLTDGGDVHRGSTAKRVAQRGLEILTELPQDKPWFVVLHFFDPHSSYENQQGFSFTDSAYHGWVQGGLSNDDYRRHQENMSEDDLVQLNALYDEEIAEVDQAFSMVMASLKSTNSWDNTAVFFTSDHGEELGEEQYIGHTRNVSPAILEIPLIVKPVAGYPGLLTSTVNKLLPQKEIFGMILQSAGLPLPSHWKKSAGCFVEVDFIPVKQDQEDKRIHKRALLTQEGRLTLDLMTGEEVWRPAIPGQPIPVSSRTLWAEHLWWQP